MNTIDARDRTLCGWLAGHKWFQWLRTLLDDLILSVRIRLKGMGLSFIVLTCSWKISLNRKISKLWVWVHILIYMWFKTNEKRVKSKKCFVICAFAVDASYINIQRTCNKKWNDVLWSNCRNICSSTTAHIIHDVYLVHVLKITSFISCNLNLLWCVTNCKLIIIMLW